MSRAARLLWLPGLVVILASVCCMALGFWPGILATIVGICVSLLILALAMIGSLISDDVDRRRLRRSR